VTPEELHDRVDILVDTDVLKLRDALVAVISKIDQLGGQSSDTDDVLDELHETLEGALS